MAKAYDLGDVKCSIERTSSGYYEVVAEWGDSTFTNIFSTKEAALEEILSYAEVEYDAGYDSFRVSAIFKGGTTVDNDMVRSSDRSAIEAELEVAREWFAEQNPVCLMVTYYKDGEPIATKYEEC